MEPKGFDEFYGFRSGFIDNYSHFFLKRGGFHDLYDGKKEIFETDKYFPDLMTKRALQFVDENKDGPFFMYVPFNLPHYPEQPDKKFDALYKDMKMPRQSYAKVISTTDDRMGRIMARLKEHGLRDNTIIIFMSDNGHSVEARANKGGGNTGKWRGNKGNFYEGGIRVPAVISYPKKLSAGIVRDQAITAMDWLPTICDLCEIPLPDVKLDGKSLMPVIRSKSAKLHNELMHWQWQNRWAVMEGQWKLIGKDNKAEFLATLSGPEPEKKNYIDEKPDIVKRLKSLHVKWLKQVKKLN